MSLSINGVLKDDWFEKSSDQGEYVRKDSQFRHWITPDGSAGSTGEAGFKAEKDRYHLYVSYACPWAHRTLIFRKLKKLEEMISVSVVHPYMDSKGWSFESDFEAATGDSLYHSKRMHDLYVKSQPDYSGVVTVPVIWDKKQQVIVNNESSEIIRMFNSAFNHLIEDKEAAAIDFFPENLQDDIERINTFVYDNINNGVYRTGFASTQAAYERAFDRLFNALDEVEKILASSRYLTGNELTEADWRLFVTLIRFDAVYVGHFKCNKKRIADYPALYNFMLELYQYPGVAETTFMEHIKNHYYTSHQMINPTGIVPLGPEQDLNAPHNRGEL